MSPHRQLSISSHRHPTEINEIFLGLGLKLHDTPPPSENDSDTSARASGGEPSGDGVRDMEYSLVLHDGTGVTESETYHYPFPGKGTDAEGINKAAIKFSREVLGRILELQRTKSMDVRVVAGAQPIPDELQASKGIEWMASVWLHLDAIPFIISPATTMFKRLPTPDTQASASSAISSALKYLHPATHSATVADTSPVDHEVLVDCDGKVRLCSLLQYQQSTSPELWNRFTALSRHLLAQQSSVRRTNGENDKRGLHIAFFSATPQGGGVALMRHALIRLWRMIGLDVKWYVPEGHPAVFDITKRKIHNVLQGVAPEGVEMSDEDKRFFEIWTEENYEAFWKDGATEADVVVIDDPQLTALIPIIKKKRPDAKIIFRSHIQIQANLTDDPSTPQHRTWNYLFTFVKDADLFLAHPVKQFVPKNVHDKLPVLYMPPSSDPLDGLNKPYGDASIQYVRQYFNSLASKQGGNTITWSRGYICQVARFDPSKGIDHLLAAYLQFRQKLQQMDQPPEDGGPQLIIMGHGSVDDPDGTVIYEQCHEIISSKEYELVKKDVAVVRAPPSDSVLGCIMQGAWVATQLSTREGFEVKVTEVVNKRVPIIVSDAGGIPLQVKDGINGYIVPTGDATAVAETLFDIFTGKKSISRGPLPKERQLHGQADPNSAAEAFTRDIEQPMPPIRSATDEGSTSEDFWTVGNAVKWMYLFSRVLGLKPEFGSDVEGDWGGVMGNAEGLGENTEAGDAVKGRNEWREMLKRDEEVLRGMKVGLGAWNEEKEDNVWKLVMRDDLAKGEGVVRDHQ